MQTERINACNNKPLPECEHCIKILQSYADHETTQEENAIVERCLQMCSFCQECYRLHKALIEKVRSALTLYPCPPEVVEEIKTKILELQIQ